MYRFVVRHGLVRLIGGRAVPALLLWDLAMMANRARRIPVVDRGLRRVLGNARRTAAEVLPGQGIRRSTRRAANDADPGQDPGG